MRFDWPHPIEAVFYDMDGTLLDSEPLTEAAVDAFLTQNGIDAEFDATQFHGVTWKSIADSQIDVSKLKVLDGDELSIAFQHALRTQTPHRFWVFDVCLLLQNLQDSRVSSSREEYSFCRRKNGTCKYRSSYRWSRRRSVF